MRVAIIGGGKMGEAVLSRILSAGGELAASAVVEVDPARQHYLRARYSLPVVITPAEALAQADLVLLAVKPQDAPLLYPQLRGRLGAQQVLVSILAGVPIAALRAGTGHPAIVRAMPNTPAMIGEGCTVWTATTEVSAPHREAARCLFALLGREQFVAEEKYLDMATALNGSGPAFFFLFFEALADAGVAIGLPRALAHELTLQTARGAALYAQASAAHLAQLRNDVTSPGGTTAAGLYQLERYALRAAVQEAVVAAYQRARELGAGETKG